ncbi:hypothetical protein RU98_GL001604 [Enterococcus caccae]|nr:hypothetical protein RU98_GL001604 [Enterococcus caccae]
MRSIISRRMIKKEKGYMGNNIFDASLCQYQFYIDNWNKGLTNNQ